MKTPKIKGQALALVLIVVVIAVIIVFAVSARVVSDIRQQSLERTSARAEGLAQSAVDNLTQKVNGGLQIGQTPGSKKVFGVSDVAPSGVTVDGNLGLCSPTQVDVSKRCESSSVANVTSYNRIIKFRIGNSENFEVQITAPGLNQQKTGVNGGMYLYASANNSFDAASLGKSAISIKAYNRYDPSGLKTTLVSECVWDLNNIDSPGAAQIACSPASAIQITKPASCPDTATYGSSCVKIEPTAGTGVSFYRVKSMLIPAAGVTSDSSYIELSAIDTKPQSGYNFDLAQMAFIRALVYTTQGTANDTVAQDASRLMLINSSVPEVADYVLFNGSSEQIKK